MSDNGGASPGTRRAPYSGSCRKLVLAFDVGTTYSGVSYCILDPGQIPIIKGVTQFPAQEANSTACKIPTIIYYDPQGKVRAVGAEAMEEGIYDLAQERNWTKAEWFKLHLRSKYGSSMNSTDYIPPLPPGKTVVDVIADFLTYLLECTAAYIEDTQPSGKALWQDFLTSTHSPDTSANDGIVFVLSHPNGWEGKEQSQMRGAAVKARLVPDTQEGHRRINFVTEGEASLHFSLHNGLLSHIEEGEGIVVVDAGGGTVDVSTYTRQAGRLGATLFEEIAVPRGYFNGSVFVTIAAKNSFINTLSKSPFLDDVDHITACFDRTTKLRFRTDQAAQYIKFGSTRDNDAGANIRFGQMKVEGSILAAFFQPAIDCIVQAVMEQKKRLPHTIRHAVLVGGFSASAWLFQNVKEQLTLKGVTLIRSEHNVVKTVSDGAISFYVDHSVHARVAKVTYGTEINVYFNSEDPEHRSRLADAYVALEGERILSKGFDVILSKGRQVREEEEFSCGQYQASANPNFLLTIDVDILSYRGEIKEPIWRDVDSADLNQDNFSTVFTLVADLSRVPRRPRVNPSGDTYYKVEYEVVMLFGLTELQAYLRWEENGVVKKSPAQLIYD